jgi:hypothetical protein
MEEGARQTVQNYLARLPTTEKGELLDQVLTASLAVQLAAACLTHSGQHPVTLVQFRSYLDRGIQHLQAARALLPA